MKENKNELTIYKEENVLEKEVDNTAVTLSKEIYKATDKDELDEIYNKFKINDAKKSVFRVNKLNALLDKVIEEATDRFDNRADELSNKEVLDYMSAFQIQIDKSKQNIENAKDIKIVQVNQNTVNINNNNSSNLLNGLDRESKENIIDAVKDILNSFNVESNKDKDVIDITENGGNNEEHKE